MKRLTSLLLALLLLLPLAVACKGDPAAGDDTGESETLSGEIDLGLEARDMGGVDYRILDANDHPELHTNFSETGTGSQVEQVLFQRDSYVETAYNVVLRYTQTNNTDNAALNAFTNSYNAGDRDYDMIISTLSGGRLTTLATEGYLADLASLPTLSLDEAWWSSQMTEQMSLGGKMYFSTGDIMASVYDAPMVMYANKTLLARYEITDDLYGKVDDGEWTMEYIAQLMKDAGVVDMDTNNDDKMSLDDDFYAFVTQPLRLSTQGMLVGMGYNLSSLVEDTILVDVETDVTGILDVIKNTVSPVTINWDGGQTSDDVINKVFKNDRALFLCHLMEAATHGLRDMASDYMVLPMPMYGETGQTEYHSLINGWVNCFVGVPYFGENSEYSASSGFMLEAMARTSYQIVRPVAFEKIVMFQSVREPDSVRMLNIIYDNLYLDFHAVYDFGGWGMEVANYVYRNSSFTSTLASIKDQILSDAEEVATDWLNPRSSN